MSSKVEHINLEDIEERDTEQLIEILKEVKMLGDIQNDINNLIYQQSETIEHIDVNLEKTEDLIEKSNIHLEKANKYKVKIKPMAIGAGIGIVFSLPISIPICLASSAVGTSLVGYSCLGGGIIGGLAGHKLA